MPLMMAGSRIEVIAPIDEFSPLEPGTTGTVIHVANVGGPYEQTWVEWDNHRNLMLVPEDYRKVRVL